MFIDELKLRTILRRLSSDGFRPGNLEIARIGRWYFGSVYDKIRNSAISESVASGFAESAALALTKGIVEFVERHAAIEAKQAGHFACQTDRTDGFAGFPTAWLGKLRSSQRARKNAFLEAVERYSWATWWDDSDAAYRITDPFHPKVSRKSLNKFLAGIETHAPISRLFLVDPVLDDPRLEVKILVVELKDGGIVTGGAAGEATANGASQILDRASGELFRHCLALKRMKVGRLSPETFYQERLAYFGFGRGTPLVNERLSYRGTKRLVLPSLAVDVEIPHRFSEHVKVHRCHFKNQPPFIGGALERLCI